VSGDAAVDTLETMPIIRSFLSNLRSGDISAACELLAADATIHEADSLPFGGTRAGPGGFQSLVADIGRLFILKLGKPVIHCSGSTAVVQFEIELTSRQSGRCAVMPVVDVYTITAGMISRLDVYYKDSKVITDLERPEGSGKGGTADAA
jgi:ketosteroid isomerase-like protein